MMSVTMAPETNGVFPMNSAAVLAQVFQLGSLGPDQQFVHGVCKKLTITNYRVMNFNK
jgi:hypothetical protein